MLIAHRRRALLTFCIAGMQLAWFTPFALLLLFRASATSPVAAYTALFGIGLLWVLLIDALNRFHVASPHYELAVVGLVILSTLLSLRALLYAGRPLTDMTWVGQLSGTLFNLRAGVGPVIGVIVINVILWQRAASATSQEPTFLAVGFSFRLGLLLMLLGAGLLEALGGRNPIPLLWCFFAFGLAAVALARIEDKALSANSEGSPLPRLRLLQLLIAVGLTVGLAAGLAHYFTRNAILAALIWLTPVWRVLGVILSALLDVLGWVMTPILILLEALMRRLIDSGVLNAIMEVVNALGANQVQPIPGQPGNGAVLPPWLGPALRYSAILFVLLLLLGIILLYLERVRRSRSREHAQDESGERVTLGGGILGAALDRLRNLAGLARRYGVSRQLLAAVSVQNIYANLTRLARLRGYPRRPAQPPDDYLPQLCQAFAGQEASLARITAAYMRVHYGDRPVSFEELAALRRDYHRIRHTEKS